jgi:hypothetical protein
MKKPSEILTDAKAWLTPERWTAGIYFDRDVDGQACACAHGAIAIARNPAIRYLVEEADDLIAAIEAANGSADAAFHGNRGNSLLDTSGDLIAHWYAGRAGLTTVKNDTAVSYASVLSLFDKAIELAKEEGQ